MAHEVCTPWVAADKLCKPGDQVVIECDGSEVPLVFNWGDEDYITAASNILFARTCFLYPGVCEAEIWPCIDRCKRRDYPCARCCAPDSVELITPYDVIEILEVVEDGVTLPDTDYRLERGKFLVRTDGKSFARNNFGIGEGIETTISYTHGRIPPIELQMAAAQLADALKKACNGDACDLPDHVTSLNRRGTTIELADVTDLLMNGSTGLQMVDYALSVHGNCHRSGFYDPLARSLGWGVS